jgi:adenine phosphoribosyltransferase
MCELASYIREHPGKNRCDLTLLFADAGAFARVVRELARAGADGGAGGAGGGGVQKVAAVDAMGLALGGAVARELGLGLVLLRKNGKSAWDCEVEAFRDYSGEEKALELVQGAVAPGERVLIVDDWAETGAQLAAAVRLVRRAGGVAAACAVLNADDKARAVLGEMGVCVWALW